MSESPPPQSIDRMRFLLKHQAAMLLSLALLFVPNLSFVPVVMALAPLAMLPDASRRDVRTVWISVALGMAVIGIAYLLLVLSFIHSLGRANWR
jgi:hypothetical protein